MKKMKYIYISMVLLLVTVSCNEDVLDLKNPTKYNTETFFYNEEELEGGTNAIYAGLYFGGLWVREYYFIFDLLGNDAQVATALQGELAQFAKYTYNASHGQINVYWRSLYRIILRANLVIERGTKSIEKNGPNAKIERLVGEARFLRAYAYFELTTQFGRIPVRETLEDALMLSTPRSTSLDVQWKLVESDLISARDVLPNNYSDSPGDIGRATKGAASALLGKAYLYQKKFDDAEKELAKLDGKYTLIPGNRWNDNFTDVDALENNSESVFEVQIKHIDGTNTWYMFGGQEDWGQGAMHSGRPMEYGFNDWQNVYISDAAVQGFKYKDESNVDYVDPRAKYTFYGDGTLGDNIWCDSCKVTAADFKIEKEKGKWPVEWALNDGKSPLLYDVASRGYRFKKYQNYEKIFQEGSPIASNNGKVIRYSDVLLMRAEALIMTGKVTDGIGLINTVRDRVGAFKYTGGYSQSQAMVLLKRERHVELCGEQTRFRDLVRWGDASEVLNSELNMQYSPGKNNLYFQDKHVLFPIPTDEKNTNPILREDVANDWN